MSLSDNLIGFRVCSNKVVANIFLRFNMEEGFKTKLG